MTRLAVILAVNVALAVRMLLVWTRRIRPPLWSTTVTALACAAYALLVMLR